MLSSDAMRYICNRICIRITIFGISGGGSVRPLVEHVPVQPRGVVTILAKPAIRISRRGSLQRTNSRIARCSEDIQQAETSRLGDKTGSWLCQLGSEVESKYRLIVSKAVLYLATSQRFKAARNNRKERARDHRQEGTKLNQRVWHWISYYTTNNRTQTLTTQKQKKGGRGSPGQRLQAKKWHAGTNGACPNNRSRSMSMRPITRRQRLSSLSKA